MMPNTLRIALLLAASLLCSAGVHAQAFRTYVASYGNDANPCTVGSPCRLLPAALNAVLDGGEVWILDSANFNSGTVEIAKSVSILAVPGQTASIVAVAGTPAINIATAGVVVALRNIVIARNANNPGTNGITMSNGKLLSVEDCLFANLTSSAIFVGGLGRIVNVKNTVFRNITQPAVEATNGPSVTVSNSNLIYTGGLYAYGNSVTTTTLSVVDSVIADGASGVRTYTSNSGAVVRAHVTRTAMHDNTSAAMDASTSGVGTSTIFASGNMIANNAGGWIVNGAGASVVTYGNNQFSGNGAPFGSMTSNSLQ